MLTGQMYLDSADVSLIAGSSAGVDSATVLGLIDSAHVQLRQDYAYASLTARRMF